MRYNLYSADAQQAALSFLRSQITFIEPEVYRIQYPDIQYSQLIPVDTRANEWAKSVDFFSMDKAGRAEWFHHRATDLPLADVNREKFTQGIEMAGIGYDYTLEELGQAMLIPGMNLTSEKAEAAKRAYEEFVDRVALTGDSTKGWTGLINDANVTVINADIVSSSRAWLNKTGDQIASDVNTALTGVYTGSGQVEMADTVLLPVAQMAQLATKRMGTNGETINVLEWLRKYNTYTQVTGQPLTIRAVRGLENAGEGGDIARAVIYRKDPQVLKMHIPMPHRFLPVWQKGPMRFEIPGIFRLGGLEIRRPGAVRYLDGIADYSS